MPARSAGAAASEAPEGRATQGESTRGEPAKSARLFFALWPTPAMQAALALAAEPAVLEVLNAGADTAIGASPRRVPAANYHLTLAFLGSLPTSRLADLDQVATRFAQAASVLAPPIDIVLDTLDHWRKPQVLVATASDTPPAAVALGEGLQRALVDAGFTPDLKPFRVHATIARKVRRVGRELHLAPVRWSFDSLHLVESQTHPEASAYRTVKKWVLDKRD